MKRAGTCVHFNGMGLDRKRRCEAGVNYRELVGGPDLGWCTRAPCIKLGGTQRDPAAVVPCERYLEPTAEQIAQSKAERAARSTQFQLAFPLIERVKRERRGSNWSGVVECPACKGKLHISHARSNGHVHGRCESAGCLHWME